MEYVTDYLGDGKEIKNFVKQFLERRSASIAGGFTMVAGDNVMTSVGNAKKLKNKKVTTNEESASLDSKTKDFCSRDKEPVSKTNSAEFVEVKVSTLLMLFCRAAVVIRWT